MHTNAQRRSRKVTPKLHSKYLQQCDGIKNNSWQPQPGKRVYSHTSSDVRIQLLRNKTRKINFDPLKNSHWTHTKVTDNTTAGLGKRHTHRRWAFTPVSYAWKYIVFYVYIVSLLFWGNFYACSCLTKNNTQCNFNLCKKTMHIVSGKTGPFQCR